MISVSRKDRSGRLVSEFLVGLSLLSLALLANFGFLQAAVRSSGMVVASQRALELAEDGLEQLIAQPESAHIDQSFGSGVNVGVERVYERKGTVTLLEDEGLYRVLVEVAWIESDQPQTVHLERYVYRG